MVMRQGMSTFDWLLIGHLVGDWLLQSDWMAQEKRQGLVTKAGMVHFTVYTAVLLFIIRWANINSQATYWLWGLIIFVSHWLIDATDVVDYWMQLFGQNNKSVVRLMIDQTMHILVLVSLVHLW